MSPVQKQIAYLGLAKQTAKGAAAANATYGFGVLSGKIFTAPISQDYEDQTLAGATTSDRFAVGVNRTDITPGASFVTRAFPRMIGLLELLGLGTNVDSGGGPHTHTATPALDLPYATLFARYAIAAEYERLPDCKVNGLTLDWSQRAPLNCTVDMMGIVPSIGAASFTTASDESVAPYYNPLGGTFLLDTGSNTPAAAQIVGGSIALNNNLAPIPLSKSVLPDDVFPGDQTVEGTLSIIPNDFTDWKKILTGTGAGTAIQQTPQYGSFSELFVIDANNSLTLSALRVEFLVDFPDADPSGGAMQLDLAFRVVRPTDGSAAFTAVTKNGGAYDVATY